MSEVDGKATEHGTNQDVAVVACDATSLRSPSTGNLTRGASNALSDAAGTMCTTPSYATKQRGRMMASAGLVASPVGPAGKSDSRQRQPPEINRAPFGVSMSRGLLPESDTRSKGRLLAAAPHRPVRKATPPKRVSSTSGTTSPAAPVETAAASVEPAEVKAVESLEVIEAPAEEALTAVPSSSEACQAGAETRQRALPHESSTAGQAGGSPNTARPSSSGPSNGQSSSGNACVGGSRPLTARCSPGHAIPPFGSSSARGLLETPLSVATPTRASARAAPEFECATTPARNVTNDFKERRHSLYCNTTLPEQPIMSRRSSVLRDSSQPERRSGTPTAIRVADNSWIVENSDVLGDSFVDIEEFAKGGGHRVARLKSRGPAGRPSTPTKKQFLATSDGGSGAASLRSCKTASASAASAASTGAAGAAGCSKPQSSPRREMRSSPWQSTRNCLESTQASATERQRQRRPSNGAIHSQNAASCKVSKPESEAPPAPVGVDGVGVNSSAATSMPGKENTSNSKTPRQKTGPGSLRRCGLNESRAALHQPREKPDDVLPSPSPRASPLFSPRSMRQSPLAKPETTSPSRSRQASPSRSSLPGPTMHVRRQCRPRGSQVSEDSTADTSDAVPTRRLARSDTVPPQAFRTARQPSAGLDANSTPIRTPSRARRSNQAGIRSPSDATPRDLMQSLASPSDTAGKKGGCRSPPVVGKAAGSPCPEGNILLDDAFGPWSSWNDATLASANVDTQTAAELFETFRTTEDLRLILSSFAQLFRQAVLAPNNARSWHAAVSSSATCLPPWSPDRPQPWRFPYEPIRVLLGGHWKAKQLWQKLDARCSRPEYVTAPCAGGRLVGRRALVIGAGPSGLRTAIELRLLGAQVTVLERRDRFTRLNRLHLWHWCGEELKALGARCLEPPPSDFGVDPDLLHIGISELQILLLKTSLLLGVQVLLGANYLGVKWRGADSGGWVAQVRHGIPATPSPGASGAATPAILSDVAIVVGAGGLGCSVGRSAGLESIEVGNLRSEDAIGLVCNFAPTQTGERSLRSFALARQFYERLFLQLEKETGAVLENIVYTRSKVSHYFVMTPTRRCLAAAGVLRDPSARPVLAASNVDNIALDRLVRRIVAFPFKEGEATLPEAVATAGGKEAGTLRYADKGPQLFDFSKMKRVAEGVTFKSPPTEEECEEDLMVALAGDALVEPFWPEGLGIIRGFFGALDTAYAAARWACGAGNEVVRAEHAAAYGQLKSLAAASRSRVLRDDETNYGLVPSTRYRGVSSMEVHTDSP